MNNYYNTIRPLNANFKNCIVYGSGETEIGLDSPSTGGTNYFIYHFDHCILKVGDNFGTTDITHYSAILRNSDPNFHDVINNDYEPDSTSSPAIDAGDPAVLSIDPVLSTDLKGRPRPQGINPDLGAYERR